jgi:Uma2 family endonuclease
MQTGTLLTLEQFFEMPDSNEKTGERYELAHGELIVVPPPPAIHERTKNFVAKLLILFLDGYDVPGMILVETGFTLDEESWRRPDVSFISEEREAAQDLNEPYDSGPELAIEVVSPSESRAMLARKIDHFLASGTRRVWALYPETRQVHVHEIGKVTKLNSDDTLEEPELLPGFSMRVADLFS